MRAAMGAAILSSCGRPSSAPNLMPRATATGEAWESDWSICATARGYASASACGNASKTRIERLQVNSARQKCPSGTRDRWVPTLRLRDVQNSTCSTVDVGERQNRGHSGWFSSACCCWYTLPRASEYAQPQPRSPQPQPPRRSPPPSKSCPPSSTASPRPGSTISTPPLPFMITSTAISQSSAPCRALELIDDITARFGWPAGQLVWRQAWPTQ